MFSAKAYRTSQGRIANPTKKFVIPIREVHIDGDIRSGLNCEARFEIFRGNFVQRRAKL